ncbi:protein ECERIFERUM 1 isoform X1 [Sesbania bispinosa]|nr:protein ECERIFERUM 1 isoform X1 [Sesbania bispinosa]
MNKDDYDNLQLCLSSEAKQNLVFPRSYTAKLNPSNHLIIHLLISKVATPHG